MISSNLKQILQTKSPQSFNAQTSKEMPSSLLDFAAVIGAQLSPEAVAGGSENDGAKHLSPKAEVPTFKMLLATPMTVEEQGENLRFKPNMREFMSATGVNVSDAHEILYGVIGSNADLRDWSAIMASGNVLDASRAATSQMYNSDLDYALKNDPRSGEPAHANKVASMMLDQNNVLKVDGNFARIKFGLSNPSVNAVSSSGLILKGAGSTQAQIERTAWLFGFENPSPEIWT